MVFRYLGVNADGAVFKAQDADRETASEGGIRGYKAAEDIRYLKYGKGIIK